MVNSHTKQGGQLLLGAGQVWVTNMIVFALAFWELDRGGPVARTRTPRHLLPPADFRFPQDEDHDAIAEVAARLGVALGATRVAVALKHVLPNVLSPFVVQGTVAFSQAVLIEASLSYLGLSAQPPTPSWGNMLNEGRTYLETAPWISVFPGIAIMLTVLAFNLLGDGVRDVLDPNSQ